MQKSTIIKRINTTIGLAIMFFGRMLPAPFMIVESSSRLINMGLSQVDGGILLPLTPISWTLLTIFLGLAFLWATVGIIWPSFLGILLIGTSGFAPMPVVLSMYLGNPQVVMMFFLFMFSAILMKSNISIYIARYILTRPFLKGKPWLLTATFLLTTFLVAFFDQVASVFLMWPVLYSIVSAAGYKDGDRYVTLMVVYTLAMSVLSFATDSIKAGAFGLILNLQTLSKNSPELAIDPFSNISYLVFGFIISIIVIISLLILMRFVFRVDVSALESIDMMEFQKDPLPPISIQQKFTVLLFALFAILLLLPGIIGTDNALGVFLAQNTLGISLFIVFLATFISFAGKPLANLQETNAVFPWQVFLLIATAFLLGAVLTHPSTNITLFMEFALGGLLEGLSVFAFTVAIILIAIIAANFFNALAVGLILTPALVIICNNMSIAAGPILGVFYFAVIFAIAMPAASPFAAMLFGNGDWISKKTAAFHGIIVSLVVASVLIVVGIPLSRALL